MMKRVSTKTYPRPFLKWVGGKGQLLEPLLKAVQRSAFSGRYHEPFVGGGALFFALYRQKALGRSKAFLSDTNANLIDVYLAVRDEVDGLIERLKIHKAAHNKDYYYEVRAHVPETGLERAARIIYLNKTCFNGLYRENSKGLFNVPIGKYKNPAICAEENLRAAHLALQKSVLEQRSFTAILKHAKEGDLVYFDPPYHPVSSTAKFTSYAKNDFNETDQRALAASFTALDEKGVRVMLSNSWTPLILDLYKDYEITEVFANRNVNRDAGKRGKVSEALVSNF